MTWLELQRALKSLNYKITRLDGIPGPETRAAIKAFQQINGLPVTGRVDPITSERLERKAAKRAKPIGDRMPSTDVPPWHVIALANRDVAEIVGPEHSPVIMGWIARLGAKVLGIEVRDDETPWCGTFIAMCISAALDAEPIPIPAVRASAWDQFGVGLATPALGAIIRVDRPGGGHVGTYLGEDDSHVHVLGGNTGNKVGPARIAKSLIRAIRWPSTYPLPTGGVVRLKPNGTPSNASLA